MRLVVNVTVERNGQTTQININNAQVAADAAEPYDFYRAALAVCFGILFDITDGRVARITKTQSAFGFKQEAVVAPKKDTKVSQTRDSSSYDPLAK